MRFRLHLKFFFSRSDNYYRRDEQKKGGQGFRAGEMRSIIHRFLVLCGAALVILRLFPSSDDGWISKLFLDDVIHANVEAAGMHAISFMGFTSNAYQDCASNLMSLVHLFAMVFQVVAIALTFYVITRRI